MKGNLYLIFFTLLIGFIVIEVACRMDGKYISYTERCGIGSFGSPYKEDNNGWTHTFEPNLEYSQTTSEYVSKFTTNNEGLKNQNISLVKKGKRLLVLGDSFTEGVGAPNDSAYPRILERLIRAEWDSTLQVINGGVSAADIFTEYKLFTLKMLKYKPDYVLVTINSSDFYEFIIRGGFERFVGNNELQYRSEPWFVPFYAKSFLVRRIVHDAFHYNYEFLQPSQESIMQDSSNKMINEAIDSFRHICFVHQIKLGVIFHPMGEEINYGHRLDRLIEHCQSTKVTYADELLFLKQHQIDSSNYTSIYWRKDGHFNSKGYDLLAKCAFGLVKRMDSIDMVSKRSDIHYQ